MRCGVGLLLAAAVGRAEQLSPSSAASLSFGEQGGPSPLTRYSAVSAEFGAALEVSPGATGVAYFSGVDGCDMGEIVASGPLSGKIAIMERGGCSFHQKAKNAADFGANGIIILNNKAGPAIPMGIDDGQAALKVPVIMLSHTDAKQFRLAANADASQYKNGDSFNTIKLTLSISKPLDVCFVLPACNPNAGGPIIVVEYKNAIF